MTRKIRVYRPYLGRGCRRPEVPLCPRNASLADVWMAYERYTLNRHHDTLKWLCEQYLVSRSHRDKPETTRRDYEQSHTAVINQPLANGRLFGDFRYRDITTGVLARYRDKRGETARVRANRELSYVSTVFSWAREQDYVKTNPAVGLRHLREAPRQRLVEDWEYRAVYRLARRELPWYIAPYMELAYLMRMRKVEILTLQRIDVRNEGILVRRRKGSRSQIVTWSRRLARAVRLAGRDGGRLGNSVLCDHAGQPVRRSAFDSAWARLMRKALARGLVRETFTPHDLKRKGVTEFDGEFAQAAGHKSPKMRDVYDLKIEKTPPTR